MLHIRHYLGSIFTIGLVYRDINICEESKMKALSVIPVSMMFGMPVILVHDVRDMISFLTVMFTTPLMALITVMAMFSMRP